MKPPAALLAIAAILLALLALKLLSPDHATWYGESFAGKIMANGQPFNPHALTAASWDYPLGAQLKIIHRHRWVIVRVTDRGGKRGWLRLGKTIDLTPAAFARLENPSLGSIRVKIVRIQ